MRMTKQMILSVAAAASLSMGCMGPGMEENGLDTPDETAVTTAQQALNNNSGCYLVVYEPFLVWNSPGYVTRGFAYVSCTSWQKEIDLTVSLQDTKDRTRHFTCYNTSTCAGGIVSFNPWGDFRTKASASASPWSDAKTTDWVTVDR